MSDDRITLLSEAYDSLASAETTTTTPAPEPVETTSTAAPETAAEATTPTPEAAPAATPARVRDPETGRFAPKTADAAAATPTAAPEGAEKAGESKTVAAGPAKVEGAAPSVSSTAAPSTETSTLRAPSQWKPAEREVWDKIPKAAQEAIVRRANEDRQALQQSFEARKQWDAFSSVVAPYEPMIRASGATHPLQVVQNLLATASVLRNGTAAEKAQMGARIIKDFGIDVEALAASLDGQPAQGRAQPQVDPQAIAQQAEARIMATLRSQAAQATAQRQTAMLQKFAESRPFFEDVREKMADILAARGLKAPSEQQLSEVYDLACTVDPEVSGILKQRKAAEEAQALTASTQKAKAAATSIRSTPTTAPAAQPTDRRAVLEAKYAEIAGR